MNFYEFYRMVETNQTLYAEYVKRVSSTTQENQPQRFVFTIRASTDAVLLNCGTLDYSLDGDQESNETEIGKNVSPDCGDLNENSVNVGSDSRTIEGYDDANLDRVTEGEVNTDSDSNNKILFSRKNIDEKLPEHLKVRTSKEKSDAQIKEFVNLVCNICSKTSPQFNSFKELQEHFNMEHKQRGYVECCDKKFYRKDRLMNHITNHIYPDAFK